MTDVVEAPEPAQEPQEPFDSLLAAVERLAAQCGREHDRAAVREKVIDRLHQDNERLRAGDRHLLLRPLLTDIQRTRHEMLRESTRLPEQMPGRQVAEMLRSFAYTLELTLERGGVQVIVPQVGAAVDPARQRVTATLETSDQDLDTTVAAVVMDGYFDTVADRVMTPAEVHVHRWHPGAGADSEDTANEPTDEH